MKADARRFLVRASQSGASNALAFLVSMATTLVLPKLLGVEDYSLWQLYVFFLGYFGVLQFGWTDGIYLRYGGRLYAELDRPTFAAQFRLLAASQVLIAVLIVLLAMLVPEPDRAYIVTMTALTTAVLGTRTFVLLVYQATNLIGHYARVLVLESSLFIVATLVYFLSGGRGFEGVVACDLLARTISLVVAVIWSRDLVLGRVRLSKAVFAEAWQNLSVGIKLMIANLASILMVGIVRFAIEQHWDVTTFGKVSLALSVSNIFMVSVSAVGVVVFPTLRRIAAERKPALFLALRAGFMAVAVLMLLLYFPMRTALAFWLPDYRDALVYLGLLFPAFVYEGRMALLINAFLKDVREERALMLVNAGGVVLSVGLALITTVWLNSIVLAAGSIILLIVARATVAELVLWRRLGISALPSMLGEIALTVVFVASVWLLPSGQAAGLYPAGCAVYLLVSIRLLKRSATLLRDLVLN